MKEAKEETGLKIVTEIVAIGDIDLLVEYVDMIQIGDRNCQNFVLLKAVGQIKETSAVQAWYVYHGEWECRTAVISAL